MEKTRVGIGEKYWVIKILVDGPTICKNIDWGDPASDAFFESDNYFHIEEEAESMVRKLRTVFKGADVIEMPSEEEWKKNKPLKDNASVDFLAGKNFGWWSCVKYIKSKIVK